MSTVVNIALFTSHERRIIIALSVSVNNDMAEWLPSQDSFSLEIKKGKNF